MFDFFKNYIIYQFNDSLLGFLANYYRYIEQSNRVVDTSINVLNSLGADFVISCINNFLSKYIDFITLNNLFVLAAIILSVIFSFKFFRKLNQNSILSIIFSIIYSLSGYFIYRVISATSSLYFIFLFPLVIDKLISKKHSFIIGMLVFLSLLISSYYGYFLFITGSLWYLSCLFIKKISLKVFFKNIFAYLVPIILGIVIFFGPVFIKNTPLFGKYSKSDNSSVETNSVSVYRAMDDWYAFSFRPWYFVIPPKNSVFFGNFSKNLHSKINNTNYYLADDYVEQEMAGAYIGWHFLIGMVVVSVILFIKKIKNKEYLLFKSIYENNELISKCFFIILCILLITGPPSFTIGGHTIYTPSYLFYYVTPVFRVLTRWTVVIFLFVLIINMYLVQDIYNLIRKTWQKVLFICVFVVLNFIIFAVKIPVININEPPSEIAFLEQRYPESVSYAVYPRGDYYSIFWTIRHKDTLVNPTNFIDYKTGFNSDTFSESLVNELGIKNLREAKTKYLILYLDEVSINKKIQQLNQSITSKEDLEYYFELNYGKKIYSYNNVVIFESKY